MIEFLFAPENVPFMIALGLMVALGLLEGVTAVLGLGVSNFIDTLLPDADIDVDAGIDVDADLDLGDVAAHGPVMKLMGWLRIGRVPVLVLLVIYLFSFGFLGIVLQSFAVSLLGGMLPAWVAVWPPFVAALFVVHFAGGVMAKLIPKDETEAVSERKFVGRVACITIGRAWQGHPAEARLKDSYGRTHYVMVEPDVADVVFEQGANVLLVGREGTVFRAIDNPNDALIDS